MNWVKLRCPTQGTHQCGHIFSEISSTMQGPIQAKCPDCRQVTVIMSSEAELPPGRRSGPPDVLTEWVDVRCDVVKPVNIGVDWHCTNLVYRVSSTMSGPHRIRCRKCKTITITMSSEVAECQHVKAVSHIVR